MKSQIRELVEKLYLNCSFLRQTHTFKKRYKNISRNLFINSLEDRVISEYKKKWSFRRQKVEVIDYIKCCN